jgi:hypothetical protein
MASVEITNLKKKLKISKLDWNSFDMAQPIQFKVEMKSSKLKRRLDFSFSTRFVIDLR